MQPNLGKSRYIAGGTISETLNLPRYCRPVVCSQLLVVLTTGSTWLCGSLPVVFSAYLTNSISPLVRRTTCTFTFYAVHVYVFACLCLCSYFSPTAIGRFLLFLFGDELGHCDSCWIINDRDRSSRPNLSAINYCKICTTSVINTGRKGGIFSDLIRSALSFFFIL